MKTYLEVFYFIDDPVYLFVRNGIEKFLTKSQFEFLTNQLSASKIDKIYHSPNGGFISIEYTL